MNKPPALIAAVLGAWITLANTALALPFQAFEPRSLAMGGAVAALADRYTLFANPAALSVLQESQNVFLELAALGRQQTRGQQLEQALADFKDNGDASTLNGQQRQRGLHAGGSIGLPNLPIALGAALQGYFLESLAAYAPPTGSGSQIRLRAISVIETRVTLARVFGNRQAGANRLALGVSPKLQLLRSYAYDGASETTDLAQIPWDVRDQGRFNIDLGLVKEFAYTWKVGLMGRDILPSRISYANGEILFLEPQWRAGLSHRSGFIRYAMDVDLNPHRRLNDQRTRDISLGLEWLAGRWRIRSGIKLNAFDLTSPSPSLGLGLMFKHARADAGIAIDRRQYLARFRLGLSF